MIETLRDFMCKIPVGTMVVEYVLGETGLLSSTVSETFVFLVGPYLDIET